MTSNQVRRTVFNLLWVVVLICIAIAGSAVQLDRQSSRDPHLARAVPDYFRSFAQTQIALSALEAESAGADRESAKLLLTRPIPEKHLAIFALAASRSDEPEVSAAALQLAAMRGWREPLVQYYVADAALRSGNAELAAQRILALWMLGNRDGAMKRALSVMLADPVARASTAQWLVETPQYASQFAKWGAANLEESLHPRLLAQASGGGLALGCDTTVEIVQAYLNTGAAEAAKKVWRDACNNGKTNALASFTGVYPGVSRTGDLAGWGARNGASFGSIDCTDCQPSLEVINRRSGYVPVAERVIPLAPGIYRLNLKMRPAVSSLPYRLEVICFSDTGKSAAPVELRSTEPEARIKIEAADCPVQRLRFVAPPGSASITQLGLVAS